MWSNLIAIAIVILASWYVLRTFVLKKDRASPCGACGGGCGGCSQTQGQCATVDPFTDQCSCPHESRKQEKDVA